MACEIELTRGLTAVVDDEDFARFGGLKWLANGKRGRFYAMRHEGGRRKVYLHRAIAGAQRGEVVDHIDGDPLNNRRSNLRIVTAQQNCWNVNKTWGKSGEIGVYPARNGWMASIRANGQTHYLGYFKEKDAAVSARRTAEKQHFGEFARCG